MDRVQRTALEHPAFDLTSHWRRGGFRESLTAGSDRDSAAFLDRLIANDLFVLPGTTLRGVEIRRDRFLRLIARYNGHQLESLRRRTGWDRPTFDHVIGSLIAQDAIFTLPFEPVIAERSNLYYFRDTGILHRLFNPKWTEQENGRGYFAKSWEGLAIQTIMYGPGRDADASVWRHADDEIDLVLRWPGGTPCWAIEIGMGEDKRPSRGFWTGVEHLGATRRCIIHRGACDELGNLERLTLERFLESWSSST